MNLFPGTLLDPQGRTLLEGLNVSLEIHSAPDGTEVWSGCFEPPSVSGVISGKTFRLVLEDGRTEDILIEYVEAVTPHASRVLFKTAACADSHSDRGV